MQNQTGMKKCLRHMYEQDNLVSEFHHEIPFNAIHKSGYLIAF